MISKYEGFSELTGRCRVYISMRSVTVSTTAKTELGLNNQICIIRKLRVACLIANTISLPLHS